MAGLWADQYPQGVKLARAPVAGAAPGRVGGHGTDERDEKEWTERMMRQTTSGFLKQLDRRLDYLTAVRDGLRGHPFS